MASSPSLGRGRSPALAHAETSPRTLVGLHRVNAQLQQELDKIDRQAFTAVSNIANHQQAMKMSWRRLEAQRSSPKTKPRSRSCSDESSPAPPRRTMMSNKTKLYVSATPQIYSGTKQQLVPTAEHSATAGGIQDDADVSSSRSSSRLSSRHHSLPISSSPYISSPHMYRRDADVKSGATPPVSNPPPASPLATTVTTGSSVKLPPVLSSSSQPSLVATTNKDTLLKVSHLMGLDSQSHGPKSFHGFYTDRALARYGAMQRGTGGQEHEMHGEVGDRRAEGGEGGEGGVEGELSLAQQFEQIRHCRYIRHYRPDGSAVDEPMSK